MQNYTTKTWCCKKKSWNNKRKSSNFVSTLETCSRIKRTRLSLPVIRTLLWPRQTWRHLNCTRTWVWVKSDSTHKDLLSCSNSNSQRNATWKPSQIFISSTKTYSSLTWRMKSPAQAKRLSLYVKNYSKKTSSSSICANKTVSLSRESSAIDASCLKPSHNKRRNLLTIRKIKES